MTLSTNKKSKVFVPKFEHGAGKWIYDGYALAWESLGFDVTYSDKFHFDSYEHTMIHDYFLSTVSKEVIEKVIFCSENVYCFVSPNTFPDPWGQHNNYVNSFSSSKDSVEFLKSFDNVKLWSFCKPSPDYYHLWGNVEYVPLAFDDITYIPYEDDSWAYDVAYCGGWADNGFNTKRQIMKSVFSEYMSQKVTNKLGFFINKNITNEQEAKLYYNSSIVINIHDDYTRNLQLDTNERTFKALGLCGCLVTDENQQVRELFPELDSVFYVPLDEVDGYLSKTQEVLANISSIDKQQTRNLILSEHTYKCRVNQLLEM